MTTTFIGACADHRRGESYEDSDRARWPDHAPAFNARMTSAIVAASASWPIRTVTPPASSSIAGDGRAVDRLRPKAPLTALAERALSYV